MDINEFVQLKEMFQHPPKWLRIGSVEYPPPVDPDRVCDRDDVTTGHQTMFNLLMKGVAKVPKYVVGQEASGNSEIILSKPRSMSVPWPADGVNVFALDVNTLLKMAEPAPYGDIKDMTTKVDKQVRSCSQISDGITSTLSVHVMSDVINTIYPSHPKVEFVFNKINIYGPGDHFSKHVDTPKPGVIGTLILYHATKDCKGGDLVLHLDDGDVVVGAPDPYYEIGYCAFYSNIPHTVTPVISGHRVSATFYIMESEKDEVLITALDINTDQHIDDPLELLALDGGPFGIILEETYSMSEVNLKGRDSILISKLQSKFDIEIVPVIITHKERFTDVSEHIDLHVYRFLPSDFEDYRMDLSKPSVPIRATVPFYTITDDCGGVSVLGYDQPYIEHVGNECQEGIANNVYVNKAAIATLRP